MRTLFLLIITFSFTMAGCTLYAPQYEASMTNIQKIKRSGTSKINVSKFIEKKGQESKLNGLTFRGSSFLSPKNGSYAKYIEAAIKKEIYLAGRFSEDADIELSSVLLKNDFDGSGMDVGVASISAKFVVRKNGKIKYDKIITVNHKWESYFAAFSALPAAQQGYISLVQKFIGTLFNDKEFIKSIS